MQRMFRQPLQNGFGTYCRRKPQVYAETVGTIGTGTAKRVIDGRKAARYFFHDLLNERGEKVTKSHDLISFFS